MDRRTFVLSSMAVAAGALAARCAGIRGPQGGGHPFEISLAEWSLHRAIRSGALDHLDFPATARRDYGIEAVEYVSTLFGAKDGARLGRLGRLGRLERLGRLATRNVVAFPH